MDSLKDNEESTLICTFFHDTMRFFPFLDTGLRVSELCDLKLDDVDWSSCDLIVRKGKGGKSRLVPVYTRFLEGSNYPSLKNYVNHWRYEMDEPNLFVSEFGALSPPTIRRFVKELGRRVGCGWLHPHNLRHYCATILVDSSKALSYLQYILGHLKSSKTSIYYHNTSANIHKRMEKIRLPEIA